MPRKKNASRQLRWQRKRIAAGKCSICGEPRGDSPYASECIECRLRRRESSRVRNGHSAHELSGRGHAPKVSESNASESNDVTQVNSVRTGGDN